MDEQELGRRARRLRDVTEPSVAGVYFAPEANGEYPTDPASMPEIRR